jgi:hypothetical protein
MRNLIVGLTAMLFPVTFASAQDTKPVELADYVSFCLALWADAPDIQAKASALGLQNKADHVTIGRSTVQAYTDRPGALPRGAVAVTTIMADGKDLYCDVSVSGLVYGDASRTDLETMEQTLHLDGQIVATSATVGAHWKMPRPTASRADQGFYQQKWASVGDGAI